MRDESAGLLFGGDFGAGGLWSYVLSSASNAIMGDNVQSVAASRAAAVHFIGIGHMRVLSCSLCFSLPRRRSLANA